MNDPGNARGGHGDLMLPRRAVRMIAPFAITGTAAILVGGGVAAAARPAGWASGSWAAAYLVLVAGLGSWVGGLALALIPEIPARDNGEANRPGRAPVPSLPLLAVWIPANAGVLAGNLLDLPALLVLGAILLLVVLVASMLVLQRTSAPSRWLTAYTAGVVLLAVSVPIGIVLAAR